MTSEWREMIAADGHHFGMYVAQIPQQPKGAVVVLPEIFGINAHIRSVCDRLSDVGYVAAAPRLFDRLSRDYEAGYTPRDVANGLALMQDFDFEAAELDIAAAIGGLAQFGVVSLIGFCIGGSLAYRMASQSDAIGSAACYYGGLIEDYADLPPRCPVVLHYGETDASITPDNVATVRRKQPDLPVFVYPAGHGFNCDARGAYEPASAALAWDRTMQMINAASRGS